VASAAERELLPTGTTVFAEGDAPVAYLRVIRTGTVEILTGGRLLDLLGEGEMFGYASMLSGLPAGFAARALEDTVCYRIASDLATELLSAPEGLRYVARSLLEAPTDLHILAREPTRNLADQPVSRLVRGEPVLCDSDTTIREAAQRMKAARQTCVIVDLGERKWGILTDRDVRTRVLAAGLAGDAPVSAAMSAPAYTCAADQPAGEVLLAMLDRGFRHFPVVSARGTVLGVVEDVDLVAVRTRSSFYLRERIALSRTVAELIVVARELRPMMISLHEANVDAANVMAMYAVVVDALTRRLLELEAAARPAPGVNFAWLALGSQARREALPSSDVDSAIVWFDGGEGEADGEHGGETDGETGGYEQVRERLLTISRPVAAAIERCGLRVDAHGANAASPPFVRSVESWQREARSWIEDPTQEKALLLAAVLVDSRPVWGVHTGTPVSDTFRLAPDNPAMLRLQARFALAQRPPTGFFRGLVIDHSGVRRGGLDLKRGGVMPIVALARWAAMCAGVTIPSTVERLRAAGEAGIISQADAHTLRDAFELLNNLRLEHQVRQLRAGEEPDDHVNPAELSSLMRTHLKVAFRAVTSIQKRVHADLSVGVR
jgi:CBS domain-containing protein